MVSWYAPLCSRTWFRREPGQDTNWANQEELSGRAADYRVADRSVKCRSPSGTRVRESYPNWGKVLRRRMCFDRIRACEASLEPLLRNARRRTIGPEFLGCRRWKTAIG